MERYKFINEVVKQITVHIDRVEIEYKTDGLEAVITETEAANIFLEPFWGLRSKNKRSIPVKGNIVNKSKPPA